MLVHSKKKTKILCLHCNKEASVWKHSSAQFCSYQCSADYKTDKYIELWLKGEINGTYSEGSAEGLLHKRIKKWYKDNITKCEVCSSDNIWNGQKLNFEIDHIDGNRRNNHFSNLRYICPNCHSQTETFRAKNIKKRSHSVKVAHGSYKTASPD